jgi:hypothetical protein
VSNRAQIQQEAAMTEKIKSEVISRRRVFSLLGLAIASSLAVPATLMTATDAEAVIGRPLSPGSVAGVARRANRRGYKKKKMKASPEKTETK